MSEQRDNGHTVKDEAAPSPRDAKRVWQEPKLEFVEPKLIKQGEMKQLTAQGFIGTFVPED